MAKKVLLAFPQMTRMQRVRPRRVKARMRPKVPKVPKVLLRRTLPREEELAAARELAEHNALADVFDDVRKQSADSHLVTPDRWA